MKHRILTIVVILFLASGLGRAEDELGVSLELAYHTRWLSKGAAGYGQQGALFKTVDLDLYDTGFGLKVTHRNATADGHVDKQRIDYRPYYKGRLFEDAPYATSCNISVGYEHYPGLAREKANTTFEWIFAFSWPDILGGGLVPRYIAHYEYPAGSGYEHRNITGWVHRFGLGSDVSIFEIPQALHLSSEVAYTDGLGAAAHDWSYATFGLSTKFRITDKLYFVPGLYHQISMDDSVSERDVTYSILSMRYIF